MGVKYLIYSKYANQCFPQSVSFFFKWEIIWQLIGQNNFDALFDQSQTTNIVAI